MAKPARNLLTRCVCWQSADATRLRDEKRCWAYLIESEQQRFSVRLCRFTCGARRNRCRPDSFSLSKSTSGPPNGSRCKLRRASRAREQRGATAAATNEVPRRERSAAGVTP